MATVSRLEHVAIATAAGSIARLRQALPSLAQHTPEEHKQHKAAWSHHALFIAHTRALMASLSTAELRELATHMGTINQIVSSYFLNVVSDDTPEEDRVMHLQKYDNPALRAWAEEARRIFYVELARTVREKILRTIRLPEDIELSADTVEEIE